MSLFEKSCDYTHYHNAMLPSLSPTPSLKYSLHGVYSLLQTDGSIIGGMVVEVGDKYIDMSTATKVKKIMQSLRETV